MKRRRSTLLNIFSSAAFATMTLRLHLVSINVVNYELSSVGVGWGVGGGGWGLFSGFITRMEINS